MLKQVRQQNAYPQYERVQLKQRLRPKLSGVWARRPPPPYKGNISIADAAIACLYLLKTIKINAGVECRCGMKKKSRLSTNIWSITAGSSCVINIWTVQYYSTCACVVRLALQTNAAESRISEYCLWQMMMKKCSKIQCIFLLKKTPLGVSIPLSASCLTF